MNFDKKYTKYWSSAVTKSIDGTIIAGVNEVKHILNSLKLSKKGKSLDLGCSIGRMHEALAEYSDEIYGVDVDPYAVEQARLKPYKDVHQGSGEETGFTSDFFDFVFCWAVFDVVDHIEGLAEINRVLKSGGKLLITGKNDNYFDDDILAYKAEKNAYIKKFPNRFTDLTVVLENFQSLGFELDKLLLFPRRGNMGTLEFIDQGCEKQDSYCGYEYMIICHKIGEHDANALLDVIIENRFSKTAIAAAAKAGYQDVGEFFESIGID
jgi:SAM-dependent methyltransferase